MENYQCHISINNRTASKLIVQQSRVDWGQFMEKKSPAQIDKKAQQPAFAAQGGSALAGTEGEVIYQFETDANLTLRIYWNIPTRPGSSNEVTAKTSHSDLAAVVEGFKGSGSTEVCTIKLVDGR